MMNPKRKSTLGTRPKSEAPTRLTAILNLIPELETDNGLRNQNATQLNSKYKQPRGNRVPAQATSYRGNVTERPINKVIYKRPALKSASSTAGCKETLPHPELLKGQMAKSKQLKNSEETSALTGGLKTMRERAERARAARISSTPKNSNIPKKAEILCNRTPLYLPLAHFTPQKLLFNKHNSDFVYSEDQNNVREMQCKSTPASELSSCDNTVYVQSKQTVDENRMNHKSTNVTESHFVNENQENPVQKDQEASTTSYNLTAAHLQSNCKSTINTVNVFPRMHGSSLFCNLNPSFLQSDISQNFTSTYNNEKGISRNKPSTSKLDDLLALPRGHVKISVPSQNILSAEMQPSVKSEALEPEPSNINSCCKAENILNVPFETSSALQRNNYEETNNCNSKDDKDDKEENEAEAAALKEGTESVKGEICSLKKPQIMEIVKNIITLQERGNIEIENFMEKMKAVQKQQFEMLQKLCTVYQVAEEIDKYKQSTSITKEPEATCSTDSTTEMQSAEPEKIESAEPENMESAEPENMESAEPENMESAEPETMESTESEKMESAEPENMESAEPQSMESAEPEKMLKPVPGKKKRRSSRIAARKKRSSYSTPSTPDSCDKCPAVVAKYRDLRKSFTFLRTPRNCKTPFQAKTPSRTPRTIVSSSIRDQLQLLYDTDSPH